MSLSFYGIDHGFSVSSTEYRVRSRAVPGFEKNATRAVPGLDRDGVSLPPTAPSRLVALDATLL